MAKAFHDRSKTLEQPETIDAFYFLNLTFRTNKLN
jgi:hypothetical protein